jgi:acetyl esterase/lipase
MQSGAHSTLLVGKASNLALTVTDRGTDRSDDSSIAVERFARDFRPLATLSGRENYFEPERSEMLKANVPKLDPREEHFWVAGPRAGMQLFLRRLSPAQPAPKDRIVLYAHGGTFPSALSIAHRFDGESWRDVLCAAGFDVWAFDCYGFGASDR